MDLKELLQRIPIINEKKDYWFVRTDNGHFFETFIENEFIAVGWDEISLEDIVKKDHEFVKTKIARAYNHDPKSTKGKSAATTIYNKLLKFNNFKKGDLVIIPSHGSSRWAFGTIQDQRPFVTSEGKDDCDYKIRRKVSWDKIENFNNLDPIFNKVKTNQQALRSMSEYAEHIDIVTNSLFYKENNAHLVLNIKTLEEINAKEFFSLGNALLKILEEIDKECNFQEKIDKTSLKLYLQSPGKIELKSISKNSLIILGFMIAPLISINTESNTNMDSVKNIEILQNISNKTKNELDTIQSVLNDLKVKTFDEINSIYK